MRLSTHLSPHSHLQSTFEREKQLPETQPKLFSFLYKIWHGLLIATLTKNELRVWQKPHSDGNTEWHAYDPATGNSVCVASDAEMRIWIEQQYYQ